MSDRQGGFNCSKVIFVDAGNTSDIYQCVNFAREYGLDIKKVLQSIVISRSFTIYQLTNMIINELPKLILQFSDADAKVIIIIGDLLSMFVNEPQIQIKEADSLLRQITNAIRKMMSSYNNILFVISLCCNSNTRTTTTTTRYARLILQRIDKCIEITREGNHKEKEKNKNNNLSINITIKEDNMNHYNKKQHYKLLLQERMLHLVSYK
jgi:hypothetical protein